MIRWGAAFEALGDYLDSFTRGEYELDDPTHDFFGFVFGMQRAPSGVSARNERTAPAR
jgi:hypothetical protein